MAKDRIQMIGSEADTTKNGPLDMRQSAFSGGMVEMIGSEAEMPRGTVPQGEFDKHVRGGSLEMIGSEAPLSRTPFRGWESYNTPISENSEPPQARVSSFPSRGKK